QKTDIFRKIMWFSYDDDNNWHAVEAERVEEILQLNKKKKKPFSLLENESSAEAVETSSINSDLEEMDRKFSGKKKKNKRNKKRRFKNKKKPTTERK
ncbi:MAG: Signal peptidase-like protein, partial [Bacteroidota bacterium]